MKHVCRIVALCLIAVMSLSMLTACGAPTEDGESTAEDSYTTTVDRFSETPEALLGKYTGSYIYKENSFYTEIVLKADGTYSMDIEKNGELTSSTTGEFGAAGSLVRLYTTTDYGSYIEYRYEADTLTNNGHTFKKVS